MAKTLISDVIVPAIFAPYVLNRTMQLSALFQSGIVSNNPDFDKRATGEGQTVNMPYWADLSGNSEVLSDSGSLTPAKIVAGQDVAVICNRGKAWSTNMLAEWLAGSDPMAAIGTLVAEWWNRDSQDTLIAQLNGIFAAASMSGNVNDVAVADVTNPANKKLLDVTVMTDSLYKLGDASGQLTAIAVHSDIMATWVKANAISYVKPSENAPALPQYMGKFVIVDDSMPKNATTGGYKYTSYIFGRGAVGLGNGAIDADDAVQTDRDILAGDQVLAHRRRFLQHVRGVKWIGTPAGSSPTNAELATGTNWTRVYENKKIRVVKVVTNG